ncbi:hypothetical protein DFH27DRAFT_607787 [Peziza echinospora]|nr:hypothetical protein DFH27DRAFT_607787 [Peziza echinospora]
MPPRSTRSGGGGAGVATSGTLKHAFGAVGKSAAIVGALKSTKGAAAPPVKAGKLLGVVVPEKVVLVEESVAVVGEDVQSASASAVEVVQEEVAAVVKVKKVPAKRVPSARKRKAVEEAQVEEEEVVKVVKRTTRTRGVKKVAAAAVVEEAPAVVITGEDKVVEEEEEEVIAVVPKEVAETPRARKRTKILDFMEATPKKAAVETTTTTIVEEVEETIAVEAPSSQPEASSIPKSTPKTPSKAKATRPKATPRSNRKSAVVDPRQTTLNLTPLAKGNALSAINSLLTRPDGSPPKPEYLTHLTTMHSHLLTTIQLHLAQNGPYSLPSFNTLRPHLERLSKRTVEFNDIRKICWLSGYATSAWLRPVDYGNGKIAIEFTSRDGRGMIWEVNALRTEFESNVEKFWNDGKGHEECVVVPMAEIIMSKNKGIIESVLMAKGVQRGKEMRKQGPRGKGTTDPAPPIVVKKKVIAKETKKVEKVEVEVVAKVPDVVKKENIPPAIIKDVTPAATTTPPVLAPAALPTPTPAALPTATPKSTPSKPLPTKNATLTGQPQSKASATSAKSSLLDRIRAKHQATLLATSALTALTPEEQASARARISAEQRLPEVIPILRSLRLRAGGMGRRSMGLDEVILGIRQSMRNGITKEEAELCVRLAGETGEEKKKEDGGKEAEGGELGGWKKSWGQKDQKGWVEVVECGGVRAVVFK